MSLALSLTEHQLQYSERLMEATIETFKLWAIHDHEKVMERDKAEHDWWITSVLFCATRYINDGRPGSKRTFLQQAPGARAYE